MAAPTLDWAPPEAATDAQPQTWQPPEALEPTWTPPDAPDTPTAAWTPPEAQQTPLETGLRTIGQDLGSLYMTGVSGLGRYFENLSGVANQVVPGLGDVLDYAPQSALFQALAPVADDLRQETQTIYKPDAERNPIAATVGGGLAQAFGMVPMIATGGTPLVLGAAAASGYGQGSQTAEDLGVQNPAGQMALGVGFGAAETLVERLGGIGAGPVKAGAQQIVESLGKSTLKTIGSETLEEPVTGGLQDAASLVAASTVTDPTRPGYTITGQPIAPLLPNSPEYWKSRGMEAIGGAAGGTVFAGLGALANRGQRNTPSPTVEGDLPGAPPPPTAPTATITLNGQPYTYNPNELTPDALQTIAATGNLQDYLDAGMLQTATPQTPPPLPGTPPPLNVAPPPPQAQAPFTPPPDLTSGLTDPGTIEGDLLTDPGTVEGDLLTDARFRPPPQAQAQTPAAPSSPPASTNLAPATPAELASLGTDQAAAAPALSDADQSALQASMDVILRENNASISILQRRLGYGYQQASRMIDLLEQRGFVGPSVTESPQRQILVETQRPTVNESLSVQDEAQTAQADAVIAQQAQARGLRPPAPGTVSRQGSALPFEEIVGMAAAAIRSGVTNFSAWASAMIRRFGESVRQYLAGAWQAARKTSQVGALDIGQQNTASVSRGGVNSEVNLNAVLPAVESLDSFQSAPERPVTIGDYNQYGGRQQKNLARAQANLAQARNQLRDAIATMETRRKAWQEIHGVTTEAIQGQYDVKIPLVNDLGNREVEIRTGNYHNSIRRHRADKVTYRGQVLWQRPGFDFAEMDDSPELRKAKDLMVQAEAELYLAEEEDGGQTDRLAAKETAAEWARRQMAAVFAALLDARDKEARNAASTFLADVWTAFSTHDENFQYGRTSSNRAADIAQAVSTAKSPVTATETAKTITFQTPKGSLTIYDTHKTRPYIRSVDAASQGTKSGGGSQLYCAALDWIHNNGKQIKDDVGLTDINAVRRTSNFLSSAIRWGTTRHLKPHAKQAVKFSATSDTRNIAALATREMEHAFIAVAEAREWQYDFDRNEFTDTAGTRISEARFENAIDAGNPAKSGVGLSTLQRAIITNSAIQSFQRGDTEGTLSPASIRREARSGLKGILYFDPFGLMVAADAMTRLAKASAGFASFSRKALQRFGSWISPHLKAIWQATTRGTEAVRRYLAGAWQAAKNNSQVGARANLNPNARISARPPTMAEAMEGQTRESQFGQRVQADERLTDPLRAAPVSTFAKQTQDAALDQANALIRDIGLEGATAQFTNDASLPMPVRIIGLMQAALQYDARAALAQRRGNEAGSAAADAATAAAIDAKATLEIFGNESGRNLAAFNTWARMSPDGQLRRLERDLTKTARQTIRGDQGVTPQEVTDLVIEETASPAIDEMIDQIIIEGAAITPVNLQTGAPIAARSAIDVFLGGIETVARAVSESSTIQTAVAALDRFMKALNGKLFADPFLLTPAAQAVLKTTRALLLQGTKLSQAIADAIAVVRTKIPIPSQDIAPLTQAVTAAVVKEVIRPILRKLAFDPAYNKREATKDMLAIGIGVMEAGRLADAVIAKRPKIAKAAQDIVRQRVMRRLSDKPRAKSRKQKLPAILDTLVLAAGAGFINERTFLDAWDKKHPLPKLAPADRQRLRQMAAAVNLLPEGVLRQEEAIKFLNQVALIEGIPTTDLLVAAWYANILSGASTQAVNVWGNAFNLAARTLAIGLTSPTDFSKLNLGLTKGLQPSLREAREVLRTGNLLKVGKMDDMQKAAALELMMAQGGPRGFGQWIAYLISVGGLTRFVFRGMGAADAVFWYSAQEGMAHAAVSRTLRKAGGLKPGSPAFNAEFVRQLGGDEQQFLADLDQARTELQAAGVPVTPSAVNRRAYEIRVQRRSQDIRDASVRWADRITNQQQPEGSGALISKIIGALQNFRLAGVPVFLPIAPFNRIVSNFFEGSLDFAGVGILRGMLGYHLSDVKNPNRIQFDNMERAERFGAGVIGLTAAGFLLSMAMAVKDMDDEEVPFMVYAMGPPDPTRRGLMPKGWRPFTMKIGKNYVGFAETPIGPLLGAVGGWMDSVRYGKAENKTLFERGLLAFMHAVNSFNSMGALSTIKDLGEILQSQGSLRAVKQTALSPVPGFIPAQGFMRDVATIMDDTKISDAEVFGALVKDIPILKAYGKPALNVLGEEIKLEGTPIVRRFTNKQRPDDNIAYIQKHRLRISALPRTIEIGKYLPARAQGTLDLATSDQRRALGITAIENGVMTPDQQFQFTKTQGEKIKEGLIRLRKSTANIPPSPQATKAFQTQLDKISEAARQTAMLQIIQEVR